MLVKIAWKNIWRNKVRSFVVITAIALGLLAGVFASGFVNGMMMQKVDSVVKMEMSHFQIHQPEFREELKTSLFIKDGEKIKNNIAGAEEIQAVTGRVISNAMFGSANHSGAVKVTGIDPEEEALTTGLNERLVEGKYFEGIKRNPVFISRKIAEKYKIKLRSKVVITLQDVSGEMVAGAFRVVGIFDSKNNMYDKVNVFVRKADLQKLLKLEEGNLHEIAILLKKHDLAETTAALYQEKYSQLEVIPWMDLSTGMRYMVEAMDKYTIILVSIILVALMFSIINTMLMAVLERVKEIGMLMAIGMKKPKIFGMIMLETTFLSLVGGPIGLALSWVLITYFGSVGIDVAGASYEDVGFATVIYPYLAPASYLDITLMVLGMSLIAAIYPARKALKLNPVEAIRK